MTKKTVRARSTSENAAHRSAYILRMCKLWVEQNHPETFQKVMEIAYRKFPAEKRRTKDSALAEAIQELNRSRKS
jgi:hypothetical protein